MSIVLIKADDPQAYNEVVAKMPLSSPLQGWAYGEARRTLGQRPERYFLKRGGETVGAVQLLRKSLLPGFSTLYAPRGPAILGLDLLPEFASAVGSVRQATDVFCKIEPPQDYPDEASVPESIGSFARAVTEQPEHTIVKRLQPSEDKLFAGLHSMARRNVRTAQKRGVTVGRDEDFEAFWEIFCATNERAKLGAFPRAYYETMLREGQKYGGDSYIVLARHEGRALAGGFFLALGDTTCYLYGGSIRDDRGGDGKRQDAKAPDAFYWNALVDAKNAGYQTFDFWGIPRELDPKKHSYGVFKMKLKFSEERVWFPAYDVPLSPLAPAVVKALRLRKTQNNLRKRGQADDVL